MADIPVNVEVTQEDLDTLIARNPQISQILQVLCQEDWSEDDQEEEEVLGVCYGERKQG